MGTLKNFFRRLRMGRPVIAATSEGRRAFARETTKARLEGRTAKLGRKIKVVFMCLGGMESSPLAKRTFEKLMKQEGWADYFELDYAGYLYPTSAHPVPELANILRGSDFIVPLYSDVGGRVEMACRLLGKKRPAILKSHFKDDISEQHNLKEGSRRIFGESLC